MVSFASGFCAVLYARQSPASLAAPHHALPRRWQLKKTRRHMHFNHSIRSLLPIQDGRPRIGLRRTCIEAFFPYIDQLKLTYMKEPRIGRSASGSTVSSIDTLYSVHFNVTRRKNYPAATNSRSTPRRRGKKYCTKQAVNMSFFARSWATNHIGDNIGGVDHRVLLVFPCRRYPSTVACAGCSGCYHAVYQSPSYPLLHRHLHLHRGEGVGGGGGGPRVANPSRAMATLSGPGERSWLTLGCEPG